MMPLETWLSIYASYNSAFFPAHVLFYVIAIGAFVFTLVKPGAIADIIMKSVLALLWAWTGVLFFILHYAPHNTAGYTFGVVFLILTIMFVTDIFLKKLDFDPKYNKNYTYTGIGVAAWAAVLYPALSLALGRTWPSMAAFPITPGPLVIFTSGVLLLTLKESHSWFFGIPFIWALIQGIGAPTYWGLYEDYSIILLCGFAFFVAWYYQSKQRREAKKKG
ncbi:MAG: hypothetical protein JSW52_00305 [Candidatus Coatesbacteria bacterium]|nr:MAG: hypothetical protein JSW52_00305 [Candidatus Coatesbacteria bacterium]